MLTRTASFTVASVLAFDAAALQQNLEALMADLAKAKPASAKGIYIKKITVSSTMGPGLLIDQSSWANDRRWLP